jgi:hypothetical protein
MGSNLALIFLAIILCLGLFVKNVRPWFLTSGFTGFFVALALLVVDVMGYPINPILRLVLWFPSCFPITEPSTAWEMTKILAIHFLGNFLIYAVVGTLIGLGVEIHRRDRRRAYESSRTPW